MVWVWGNSGRLTLWANICDMSALGKLPKVKLPTLSQCMKYKTQGGTQSLLCYLCLKINFRNTYTKYDFQICTNTP